MQSTLSFLRPLGPPRVSTMNQFLRRSLTTASASTTAPATTSAQAVTKTTIATNSTAKPRPNLPYFVQRTPSNQLPVYLLEKRGGNLKQTKVRKIEGDVKALHDELQTYLGLGKTHIAINPVTRHIIIRVCRYVSISQFEIKLT